MDKPKVKLVGEDGNVFNLIGICRGALTRAGYKNLADEMLNKIFASKSYEEALGIMMEYCEVE